MATTTHFGLLEFASMTFGIGNAAKIFQRLMQEVTQGLWNVYVYLDIILVASHSGNGT